MSIALTAATGVAIFNGIAAILQKIGADREDSATSLKIGMLLRLYMHWPYLVGASLDILSLVLTIVALQSLPLFVVQPIAAFSVAVTVFIEAWLLRRRVKGAAIASIGCILLGLVMLAIAGGPEHTPTLHTAVRWVLVVMPLVLAILGSLAVRLKGDRGAFTLAILGGIALGGTAIIGRALEFSPPYWQILMNPLIVALVANGILGILLFSIALQRHHASIINAIMISAETVSSALVGLTLLGDRPRHHLAFLAIGGMLTALIGTVLTVLYTSEITDTSEKILDLQR
ncbi:MAG: hypothetical protein JWM37_493 [Candidatus Saccharibacteria bacterium]|nr:hypothetical protein [Candidatus Saccharibacteria bacterium]